jgi:predicted anti-sigma-YlaC factor YlaD
MDCDHLQAILAAMVEFEIAGGDLAVDFPQTVVHLAQCPACAEEYQALLQVAKIEAQRRLPQIEESLKKFEAAPPLRQSEPA